MADTPAETPADVERAGRSPGRIVLAGVVVALGVVLVVHSWAWISGGFGYSLDGFNGAVWGQGARAAVDAPVASRLGGVQPDGHRYANHPPLTVWSAAVMSAASGDSPIAVRLPAVAASVAALAVLVVLLRDAGVGRVGTAVGLAVAGTSSMYLAYGAMLDTPVVSLPCGLAVLAAAQRVWRGRPPPPAVLVGLAALAGTAGWQATLLTGCAGALCLLVDRRATVWLAAGAVLGSAIAVGWIAWVHGSLRPLLDQAGFRSGATGQQVTWLTAQGRHLGDLYGPVLLVVVAIGLVAALLPPADGPRPEGRTAAVLLAGTRPLAVVLGAVVGGYTVGFRNGSAVHDYWTFWGVALVAVAVAVLADRAVALLARVAPSGVAVGLAAVVAVVAAGIGLGRGSGAEDRIRSGLDLVAVLDEAPDARVPTDVAIAVHDLPGTLPWADYAVDGRSVHADDAAALRALPPDLPVLVVLRGASAELRELATAVDGAYALVPAGVLAQHVAS